MEKLIILTCLATFAYSASLGRYGQESQQEDLDLFRNFFPLPRMGMNYGRSGDYDYLGRRSSPLDDLFTFLSMMSSSTSLGSTSETTDTDNSGEDSLKVFPTSYGMIIVTIDNDDDDSDDDTLSLEDFIASDSDDTSNSDDSSEWYDISGESTNSDEAADGDKDSIPDDALEHEINNEEVGNDMPSEDKSQASENTDDKVNETTEFVDLTTEKQDDSVESITESIDEALGELEISLAKLEEETDLVNEMFDNSLDGGQIDRKDRSLRKTQAILK